jgi:hypothetical protein
VRLGFAVKVLGDGGLPSHDTRRWLSGPHLRRSLADVLELHRRTGLRVVWDIPHHRLEFEGARAVR